MSAGATGRGWAERLNRFLDARAMNWVLLGGLATLYSVAYFGHELNPGATMPIERHGWWSWADQTKYVEAAVALAQGKIDATSYYFPLGYSALAAPFVRVLPTQPFFWPDLACVLLSATFAWQLARRWLSPLASLILAGVFIATHAALLRLTMVVPWNTLPTQAAFLGGMLLVLTRRDGAAVVWLALVAAVTYWIRPADAACLAPLLVFATLRLPAWRARVGWGAVGVAIIAGSVGAMAWLNLRTFGHWRTPYEQGTFENIGFFSYPVLHKAYWLLVDGESFFGESGSALLWRYPWLFLAVPGAVWWIRRDGGAGATCVAAIALNWGLYFNYNDFVPSAVFRFSLIHYLTWSFAPLAIAATAAIVSGWREHAVRWAGVVAVGLFALAIGIKLKERRLPAVVAPGEVCELPTTRPLWLVLPDEKPAQMGALRLDGRVLREAADFQLPYAPVAEARVMLSQSAQGRRLVMAGEKIVSVVPQVGDYEWRWWPRWRRLMPPRE
ncbi:hypothetical protein [Oleiharenicola sp. Vm1]|uniref:hypothetical protein n=1 Tax=Oleiharenicola sp. Vm1 TaxID=3398393 RepID=UPI0039F4C04D